MNYQATNSDCTQLCTMYNVHTSNECGSSPKSVRPLSHLFEFLFFFLWIRLCTLICHFRSYSYSYSLILKEQSSVLSIYFEIFFVYELFVSPFFLLCTIDKVSIVEKRAKQFHFNSPSHIYPLSLLVLVDVTASRARDVVW